MVVTVIFFIILTPSSFGGCFILDNCLSPIGRRISEKVGRGDFKNQPVKPPPLPG
jgi:hypothetical protein